MDLLLVGRNIKHYRRIRKYTLDDFQDVSGIKKDAMSRYERGRVERLADPYDNTLEKIASALDVTVADLTGEPEPANNTELIEELRKQYGELLDNPQVMEILKMLLKASAEERKKILEVVAVMMGKGDR